MEATEPSARRRLPREVVLAAASVALCLLAAEASLRWLGADDGAFYVWPPGLEFEFHPAAGVMPGIEGVSRFRINDAGVRGDPFRDEQRYRILAVGGSTTESLYLDDTETWPQLLQQQLNRRLGERDAVWVGNVGKSGRNSRHHVFQVRELLPQYPHIDAVLLLVGINDFVQRLSRDDEFRTLPQEPPHVIDDLFRTAFSVMPSPATHPGDLTPHEILRRLRALRGRLSIDGRDARDLAQDEAGLVYTEWREHRRGAARMRARLPDLGPALDEYRQSLLAIAAFAARSGTRVIFATQPTLWAPDLDPELEALLWMGGVGAFQREPGHDYYEVAALAEGMSRYNRALLDTCREHGLPCIDLAGELPSDTSVFYDDCHFNESGARQVASVFADYLSRSPDLQAGSMAASTGSPIR